MDLPRLKITNDAYIKNRYTHILLLGKSGTGKSSMITSWWYQDNFYPVAKILIEPSGFLAKDCYKLSKGKAHYCSLDTPVSINPMMAPHDPNQISESIAEALNQVIKLTTANQDLTAKMRGILDEEIKYCLANNRKSLLNVLDRIKTRKGDGETRDGIIQRMQMLLSDDRLAKILCGNDSIKIGEMTVKKENFILDCSGMGKDKMIFIGNLVSQSIKNCFRYEKPKKYKPLAVYVDECVNFINYNFMDILREGRKYKLSCVLSAIDLNIDEKLARTMLNVGNIITFRVGAKEAQLIANELGKIKEDEIIYRNEWKGGMPVQIVDKVIKYDTKELIQFLEKYHLAYMTTEYRGTGKAPRPPFITKGELKRPEPKSEPEEWFVLESYRQQSL